MTRGLRPCDPTLLAYVFLTLLALWALADQLAPYHGEPAGCRVGRVHDGDTVELLCDGVSQTARLQGFDTAETRDARCPEERSLGLRATARLRDLIRAGKVEIFRRGYDRYGRVLIALTVDGHEVGEMLIAEGLARPYAGGARSGWCL